MFEPNGFALPNECSQKQRLERVRSPSLHRTRPNLPRRALLAAPLLLAAAPARAAERLRFEELYGAWGVTGLRFSDHAKALAGHAASMAGFMAPPLKAEADFFVLTREPMSMCPFCSSDAEWPPDIVVAYLRREAQPTAPNEVIEVTGTLELGSWTDAATGFVSQARLRDASFRRA